MRFLIEQQHSVPCCRVHEHELELELEHEEYSSYLHVDALLQRDLINVTGWIVTDSQTEMSRLDSSLWPAGPTGAASAASSVVATW